MEWKKTKVLKAPPLTCFIFLLTCVSLAESKSALAHCGFPTLYKEIDTFCPASKKDIQPCNEILKARSVLESPVPPRGIRKACAAFSQTMSEFFRAERGQKPSSARSYEGLIEKLDESLKLMYKSSTTLPPLPSGKVSLVKGAAELTYEIAASSEHAKDPKLIELEKKMSSVQKTLLRKGIIFKNECILEDLYAFLKDPRLDVRAPKFYAKGSEIAVASEPSDSKEPLKAPCDLEFKTDQENQEVYTPIFYTCTSPCKQQAIKSGYFKNMSFGFNLQTLERYVKLDGSLPKSDVQARTTAIADLKKEQEFAIRLGGNGLNGLPEAPHLEIYENYFLMTQKYYGEELFDVIDSFSPEARVSVSHDILLALVTLHRHNIVHRDIKLRNIIVGPGADHKLHAVVSDFGLSESTGEVNHPKGTLTYLSPDALLHPTVHPGFDVWAAALALKQIFEPAYNLDETLKTWVNACRMERRVPRKKRDDTQDLLSLSIQAIQKSSDLDRAYALGCDAFSKAASPSSDIESLLGKTKDNLHDFLICGMMKLPLESRLTASEALSLFERTVDTAASRASTQSTRVSRP